MPASNLTLKPGDRQVFISMDRGGVKPLYSFELVNTSVQVRNYAVVGGVFERPT